MQINNDIKIDSLACGPEVTRKKCCKKTVRVTCDQAFLFSGVRENVYAQAKSRAPPKKR